MKQIPIPNTSSPEVRLMLQVQTSPNYVIHTVLNTSESGKHHSLKGAKPAAPGIQFHVHLKNPQKKKPTENYSKLNQRSTST